VYAIRDRLEENKVLTVGCSESGPGRLGSYATQGSNEGRQLSAQIWPLGNQSNTQNLTNLTKYWEYPLAYYFVMQNELPDWSSLNRRPLWDAVAGGRNRYATVETW